MTYKSNRLTMRFYLSLGSLILFLSSAGCSLNNTSNTNTEKGNQSITNPVSVLDLKALQSLTKITPQLAKHRTVFVGEKHTEYADHLNQLAIIKNLHKHWGKNTSIGLEMIQQPYQSFLDGYIAGRISERDMLRGVQWYDRWVYDFRLYRPIFHYAKANKIPLVALNIPKELTKRITKVGIKGLSKTERKFLPPIIDRSNANYVERITSVFGGHKKTSSKGVEKFLDAQLAWDEGMAFSAAKYLNKNPAKRMIILAGGGHIVKGEGIPDRLDRQIQSNSAIVLNNAGESPSSALGDYLLFSPEKKLPPIGLIGIGMADSKKGVLVKSVRFHSAASKAGILKNDIIVAIDNLPVKLSSDLKIWALDKKPGDKTKIKLKRNNKILIKSLQLKSKIPTGMTNFHKMGKINKKH